MRDMSNMVGGDVESLRNEREAKLNPPQYDVGQGDDDGWNMDDSWNQDASGGSMNESAFLGTSGSDNNNLAFNMNSVQQQPQQVNTDVEDQFFNAVIGVGKFLFQACKDLLQGFSDGIKGNDAFYWACYGKKLMVVGGCVSGLSLVFMFFGLVSSLFKNSFWGLIGGLLTVSLGIVIFSMNFEKGKEVREGVAEVPEDVGESSNSFEESIPDKEEESESGWGFFGDEEEEEEPEGFDIWSNLDDTEEEESESSVYEEDINIDSAMDSIREILAHTQTRQYLFEEFSRVLPILNPDFAKLKPISENSDNFIIFDKVLTDASLQVGTKEDKLPQLLELRENQFIIQIKATRPSGLKEEEIANEIANIYSKDEFGGILHEGVYATTSSVGSNYIINIFKGEDSVVTLADTYREVKDFVLDPNVKKPVVIGVNELGGVWKFDAENVYSYIFSGKPRTGKSSCVVSLVVQLAMYSSPKEIEFEAMDVKDTSSDFYKIGEMLPHFKRFEGNPQRILSRLRYITTSEADRRKKILDENEVINIVDLKKKNVDVELPYHYIIIDEMIGLEGKLSKEENVEFKALINTIVTQMPNLGVRLIMIPHRVTNDVIPKTTYTNVGFITCVKSDFKEINNTLEVTKKDFPYDLPNVGDMALKSGEINRGKVVFSHGIAVTTSNGGNEGIYRFIGKLWGMLEPEEKVQKPVNEVQEVYKGHDLSGVSSLDTFEGEDVTEDFWNDILND